ncbi:MAG: PIN domain-containing protein [Armatimonadetes bacterium]|nr:PIN domain-containing protein [Armatimonadota bacterium]
MIIPDANLLIYANNSQSQFFVDARDWWENALNGNETIGLSWNVVLAFVRLSTNPKLYSGGINLEHTLKIVDSWLNCPQVIILNPGDRHLTILSSLLLGAKVGNNLVSDAHLAALAIENRATLCSHDRDFQRFSGFPLHDPITY